MAILLAASMRAKSKKPVLGMKRKRGGAELAGKKPNNKKDRHNRKGQKADRMEAATPGTPATPASTEDFISLGGGYEEFADEIARYTPGSTGSYHLKSATPKKKHSAEPDRNVRPWLRPIEEYPESLIEMLNNEIGDFVKFMEPTPAEMSMRRLVTDEIANIVKSLWDDAEVKMFGSCATDLYLPTSDIDVVVLRDPPLSIEHMRTLSKKLKSSGIAESMQLIEKARVPIIKFTAALVGIRVDVSFNVSNGVKAAEFVQEKLVEWPALKPLIFVVKQYLLQRQLNEVFTGGVSSFSILCLVLSFLQLHPQIQTKSIDPNENLGVLLMEFFELYGLYFNFHRVGLSIVDEGSYFSKRERGWVKSSDRGSGSGSGSTIFMSIEDPHDKGNDVSAGSYNFALVKKSFEHAYRTLSYAIASRKNEKSTGKPVTTLLGLILTLDARSTSFRQVVADRYDTLYKDVLSKGMSPFAMVASKQISAEGGANSSQSEPKRTYTPVIDSRNIEFVEDDDDDDFYGDD